MFQGAYGITNAGASVASPEESPVVLFQFLKKKANFESESVKAVFKKKKPKGTENNGIQMPGPIEFTRSSSTLFLIFSDNTGYFSSVLSCNGPRAPPIQ